MINRRLFLSMLGFAGPVVSARSSLADPQADLTEGAKIVRRFAVAGIPIHTYTLKSSSMLPTLAPEDDLLGDLRVADSAPARGAIVMFRNASGEIWSKRVVGLPGDRIAFRNWRLILNDQSVALGDSGVAAEGTGSGRVALTLEREALPGAQPYQIATGAATPGTGPLNPADLPEVQVPPGCAYVLGDNRGNSIDSRWPAMGPIAIHQIVGQIVYRLTPNAGWLVPANSVPGLPAE